MISLSMVLSLMDMAYKFPSLYYVVSNKQMMVADVFASSPINLSFRRNLVGNNRELWFQLVERLMLVQLTNEPDQFIWKLTPSGVFSVNRFMRRCLTVTHDI